MGCETHDETRTGLKSQGQGCLAHMPFNQPLARRSSWHFTASEVPGLLAMDLPCVDRVGQLDVCLAGKFPETERRPDLSTVTFDCPA